MISQFKRRIHTLWRRLLGTGTVSPVRIEFYTREGCCLCDEALHTIESVRRFHIELRVIDVDQSLDLREKYGTMVPVVTVNGRERFHGQVNRVLLHRLLSAEANQG